MAKLEKLETNKVKLTFDISKEKIEEATNHVYNTNKSKFNIPGFRKGKAPRKIIEAQFGKGVFFEDAVNHCLPEIYTEAVKEHELDTVSRPAIDITDVSEEGNVTVTAEVFTKPEVDAVNYSGVKYNKVEIIVTDDEINAEIEEERKKNSRMITVEDRPVQDKDIILIDYEGFIDNVPFEGGLGHDYELTVGSKTFIDNFEDQLIGHKLGEKVIVNVTFPGEYGKEELQGKPAQFDVYIKEIKYEELPDFDDDFVQDVSEFNTVEEYKQSIRTRILADKESDAKFAKENAIMDKILEANEFEIPEVMLESQIDAIVRQFKNRINSSGIDFETYLRYVGQTEEGFREGYKDQAFRQVKGSMILESIAKKENIEISEEDIDNEIKKISEQYGIEFEKAKASFRPEDMESISGDIKIQKALEFVLNTAIEE